MISVSGLQIESTLAINNWVDDMKFSPLVSEFESEEQAASYDHWLKDKVAQHLEESTQVVAHDQVMADLEYIVATAEAKRKSA